MDFPVTAFVLFAVGGSITPGPNVLMIAAGAANNGFRATIPHVLGVSGGFALMILAVGLGLSSPIAAYPAALPMMKWVGAAWIAWIAWQVATAPAPGEGTPKPPMGLLGAALFQWINPKAWLLAIGVATVWANPSAPLATQYALMAAIFGVANLPCGAAWALLGAQAGRVLRHTWQLRMFNIVMALLLLGSMVPIFAER